MKKAKNMIAAVICFTLIVTNCLTVFAETKTVNATSSTVFINGEATSFEAYLIDDSNYFKLRDLASALNGTEKQFEVGYYNPTMAITITTNKAYTNVGGEMGKGDGASKTATLNEDINITIDEKPVEIMAYLISENNFMKLRDIMKLLDVYVGYDNETLNITIDTSKPYDDGQTTAVTPAAKPESPTYDPNDAKAELTRWITATAAIINYQNFKSFQLFDLPITDIHKTQSLHILNGAQWDILNANDLRDQISALTYGGHHLVFDELYDLVDFMGAEGAAEFLTSMGVEGFNLRQLEVIQEIGDKWGIKGVVAWDLFRVGTLVSWGYMAGYLETDEACRLMEPVVAHLKFLFTDWDEAVDNYLDGYCFWAKIDPAKSNTDYTTRKKVYGSLKSMDPGLYDDSLFSQSHISNLQKTTAPTVESIAGYWDMEKPDLGYSKVQFYFDGKGIVVSLYEQNNESDIQAGSYFIVDGYVSVIYTNITFGDFPISGEDATEVVGLESFIFYMSADGKQLIALDLFSFDSYVFNRFDGVGFPETTQGKST